MPRAMAIGANSAEAFGNSGKAKRMTASRESSSTEQAQWTADAINANLAQQVRPYLARPPVSVLLIYGKGWYGAKGH